MEIFKAIHTRQSVKRVKPDPVPREQIERLLSAAVQAPNHYKVRPWRFVVLTGPARERLGDVLAETLRRRFPDLPDEALAKERAKPLRAPLLVVVAVDKPDDPRVIDIENVCAAAAAAQNLLLAAHALGLGGMWRTGDAAYDPAVKAFLGLAADQHVIAMLYIGYPEEHPEGDSEVPLPPPARPGFEDRTLWLE